MLHAPCKNVAAEELLEHLTILHKEALEEETRHTIDVRPLLVSSLREQEEYDEADDLCRRTLSPHITEYGSMH